MTSPPQARQDLTRLTKTRQEYRRLSGGTRAAYATSIWVEEADCVEPRDECCSERQKMGISIINLIIEFRKYIKRIREVKAAIDTKIL